MGAAGALHAMLHVSVILGCVGAAWSRGPSLGLLERAARLQN